MPQDDQIIQVYGPVNKFNRLVFFIKSRYKSPVNNQTASDKEVKLKSLILSGGIIA